MLFQAYQLRLLDRLWLSDAYLSRVLWILWNLTLSLIVRDRPGRESRKIPKFRKNQNFKKLILDLKNIKLVCFRLRWVQKTQKKSKNFARFWENETQKRKFWKKITFCSQKHPSHLSSLSKTFFLNSLTLPLFNQLKTKSPQRTPKGQK